MVESVVHAGTMRYPDVPDMERQLNNFVSQVNGERVAVIDPWRAISNLGRRFRGRTPEPRDDLYVVPSDVL